MVQIHLDRRRHLTASSSVASESESQKVEASDRQKCQKQSESTQIVGAHNKFDN